MNIETMRQQWFGYGRWDAPFWFLGIEPGGEDVIGPANAWTQLGGGELVDCREHHFAFGYRKWFESPYPLQKTWRRLMLLLHSFRGEDYSNDALRAYQAVMWGARAGETCVIELSAGASQKLSPRRKGWVQSATPRLNRIRTRLDHFTPTFLVLYGEILRPVFLKVTEEKDDSSSLSRIKDTIIMLTPHPNARGYTDGEWAQFGLTLRQKCEAECLWPRSTTAGSGR